MTSSATKYPTYSNWMTDVVDNDIKVTQYLDDCTYKFIDEFYSKIKSNKTYLPRKIDLWVYSKPSIQIDNRHTPAVETMCEKVAQFVKQQGFPYKVNVYGTYARAPNYIECSLIKEN